MNLRDYPRPKNDNGIGLHFRLDLVETPNKPHISEGVAWLQQINAKWALLAGQDWIQLGTAARLVSDAGIMPVCRLVCKIDKPFIDWETGVKTLHDLGIPAYMQIFNEPGDDREWNGHPNIGRFGEKWGEAAARVLAAGGMPGMGAVLGQDEWLAAFNAVQAAGRSDIWEKAWFCVHNYGSNHPPSYPYDDVNQNGTPATPEEYAKYKFSLPFDELNELRAKSAHPGATIIDDDTSVLRVLEFKKWMTDSIGFCLPMIGGEGGWEWQVEEDHRYPKLPDEWHASYTVGVYEWFNTGKLADGTPLPDELFCFMPWIQADGQADSWWFGPLGTKQGTIDAVAAIPPFIRKFSWDESQPVTDTPPTGSGPSGAPTSTTPTGTAPTATPPVTAPTPGDSSASTTAPPDTPAVPTETPPADTTAPADSPSATAPAETSTAPESSPATGDSVPDTAAPDASAPAAGGGISYTVQQGETIWGISKKFGTTVQALIQANQLDSTAKIRVGQKLTIPR